MKPTNKFAIKLVKDNDNTILETFDTKEQALAAGEKYSAQFTRAQGFVSCIQGEFDENNNLVGNRYKLIHGWS